MPLENSSTYVIMLKVFVIMTYNHPEWIGDCFNNNNYGCMSFSNWIVLRYFNYVMVN